MGLLFNKDRNLLIDKYILDLMGNLHIKNKLNMGKPL